MQRHAFCAGLTLQRETTLPRQTHRRLTGHHLSIAASINQMLGFSFEFIATAKGIGIKNLQEYAGTLMRRPL